MRLPEPAPPMRLPGPALAARDADSLDQLNHTSTEVWERGPFYASAAPQIYATAAATIISWMLVIMLLITPRTFFVGGSVHYTGLRGRHGIIGGSTGGGSVIGVGSRPWLQKVAALTVAVSMTVATADTFKFAKQQYDHGYIDGVAMHKAVVNSIEIKITRVISDIFIWLAQVQTLIRLFPRHREKVLIKWVGFGFIVVDSIFTCLHTFLGYPSGRPRDFTKAIPTINYLFQLALSMVYAALVLYYSFTKRRNAFYHSMMWNISLVAACSIIAIMTPVAFFITDITNRSVAIWGDYFRWAGAAASSMIVWEWVERVEALEREEKKDGILGREVFDPDELVVVKETSPLGSPVLAGSGPGGAGGSGGRFEAGSRRLRRTIRGMSIAPSTLFDRVYRRRRAYAHHHHRHGSHSQSHQAPSQPVSGSAAGDVQEPPVLPLSEQHLQDYHHHQHQHHHQNQDGLIRADELATSPVPARRYPRPYRAPSDPPDPPGPLPRPPPSSSPPPIPAVATGPGSSTEPPADPATTATSTPTSTSIAETATTTLLATTPSMSTGPAPDRATAAAAEAADGPVAATAAAAAEGPPPRSTSITFSVLPRAHSRPGR